MCHKTAIFGITDFSFQDSLSGLSAPLLQLWNNQVNVRAREMSINDSLY